LSQENTRPLLVFSLFALFSVLSISPAFAQDVRTNYMPGTDFGNYKTYHWGLIPIGAIVLDFDPNKKELVWQGHATKAIDPKSTQEKPQKALNGAMKKLLKNFPPTPNKK
jgi:hypothetical protein